MVGALANQAAGVVESGANVMMGGKYGIPVGSIVRGKIQEVKAAKETEKSLAPGAGIRNKYCQSIYRLEATVSSSLITTVFR